MAVVKSDIVGEVLDRYPKTAALFLEIGMHCLGCPSARGETIEEACLTHEEDCDALLARINGLIG